MGPGVTSKIRASICSLIPSGWLSQFLSSAFFCFRSPEWRLIPEHDRDEIGLNFDDDGEFWMSYQDFLKHFTQLEMCNLSPDSMEDDTTKKWEANTYEGEWVRGVTAGGCRNYLGMLNIFIKIIHDNCTDLEMIICSCFSILLSDTFWHNPQYRITLTDVDEDDDENRCTVIVALMQKNRRAQRKKGMECLTIGFAVYNVSCYLFLSVFFFVFCFIFSLTNLL